MGVSIFSVLGSYYLGSLIQLKILIIDDHELFREGLAYVLSQLENNVTILEAGNYEETFQLLAETHDIDLVLLDLNLPGKDGFSVLDMVRQEYSSLPVVVLSASKLNSDVHRAIDAGAMGYIPKSSSSNVMLNALNLVLLGEVYIPSGLIKAGQLNPSLKEDLVLTPRQSEVLYMLAQGLSNKQISADLGIAEATTKMHITAIMKSMGVSNRTQAAMVAQRNRG